MRRGTPEVSALSSLAVSDNGGREYRAYPNLTGVRWLFPANLGPVRREGMRQFFHPSSVRGRVLKPLISGGVVPGRKVYLEEEALSRLENEFGRALGGAEISTAFYMGTPGAYRKVTAQAISPAGETLAFAKIASDPLARKDVEAEHRNLLRLEGAGVLKGRVPTALHRFGWQGNDVLLMTPGPPRPGPDRLSLAHAGFYKDIFAAFARAGVFGESPMMSRMSEKARRLGSEMPGSLTGLVERALALLENGLGSVSMPLSVAHRDFAPWNTRVGPRGLFVFDWDRLEDGVTPLYDLFHFQVIRAVLLGVRKDLPDPGFLRGVLGALWPEGLNHLPGLYLAYLLDVTLFYAEARVVAPDAGDDTALNRFADRIDRFLETNPSL